MPRSPVAWPISVAVVRKAGRLTKSWPNCGNAIHEAGYSPRGSRGRTPGGIGLLRGGSELGWMASSDASSRRRWIEYVTTDGSTRRRLAAPGIVRRGGSLTPWRMSTWRTAFGWLRWRMNGAGQSTGRVVALGRARVGRRNWNLRRDPDSRGCLGSRGGGSACISWRIAYIPVDPRDTERPSPRALTLRTSVRCKNAPWPVPTEPLRSRRSRFSPAR